jgi:hypothetical protein
MVRQRRYRQAIHRPHGLTLTLTTTLALSDAYRTSPPARGGKRVLGANAFGRQCAPGEALTKLASIGKASGRKMRSPSQRAARATG